MPFVSSSQRRLFYARPELHKFLAEFNAATPKGKKLPRHVARRNAIVNRLKGH